MNIYIAASPQLTEVLGSTMDAPSIHVKQYFIIKMDLCGIDTFMLHSM